MAVNAVTPCYRCSSCQRGFTSQCGGTLGGYKYTVQMDGNMAEYFVVPAAQANLAPIPDDVTDEQAVYACDMLSTGFMGAEHAYLQFGETVAVFAQGPVGLSATIGASLMGAGQIIAVESRPERQELAKRFGADVDRRLHRRATRWSRSWTSPRSGRRRRDRGVRLPADLRGVRPGDEARRAGVEHRLPRREPEPAAAAARRRSGWA